MDTTLITDIFTYFAKFPDKASVLKNFKSGSKEANYLALKATIEALPAESLIPEIKEFIFGMNEDELHTRIKNMEDLFLFVEYGQVNLIRDEKNDITNSQIALAVNVATKFNWDNKDTVEESLLLNKTLNYLVKIINQIKADDETNDCPLSRYFNNPSAIMQIEPKSFHNKLGWNIMFYKKENLFE